MKPNTQQEDAIVLRKVLYKIGYVRIFFCLDPKGPDDTMGLLYVYNGLAHVVLQLPRKHNSVLD